MMWLAQKLEETDSSMLNKLCQDCKLMGWKLCGVGCTEPEEDGLLHAFC